MIFLQFCKNTHSIFASVTVFVFFISAKVAQMYGYADVEIAVLLLFLYGLSIIAWSLVLASLINKAEHAAFMYYMTAIIFNVASIYLSVDTPFLLNLLASLLSPVALGLGLVEVRVLKLLIILYSISGFYALDVPLSTLFFFCTCNRDSDHEIFF